VELWTASKVKFYFMHKTIMYMFNVSTALLGTGNHPFLPCRLSALNYNSVAIPILGSQRELSGIKMPWCQGFNPVPHWEITVL